MTYLLHYHPPSRICTDDHTTFLIFVSLYFFSDILNIIFVFGLLYTIYSIGGWIIPNCCTHIHNILLRKLNMSHLGVYPRPLCSRKWNEVHICLVGRVSRCIVLHVSRIISCMKWSTMLWFMINPYNIIIRQCSRSHWRGRRNMSPCSNILFLRVFSSIVQISANPNPSKINSSTDSSTQPGSSTWKSMVHRQSIDHPSKSHILNQISSTF